MSTAHGVRYELVREEMTEARAVYAATVSTPAGEGHARVAIDRAGARVEGDASGIEAAQLAQLLAIAKTLGKKSEEGGWPRRIYRWRAPGVR